MKSDLKQTITNSVCLVTGGAGFIGSHLVDALAKPQLNNTVVIVDNLSTGSFENIAHHFNQCTEVDIAVATTNYFEEIKKDNVVFIKGDITNGSLLDSIFKKYGFMYVFHQAAIPSVPRSVNDPVASNNATVNGTVTVLVACKNHNVKKVMYAASSSAYGDTKVLPKSEDMMPLPLSPYAAGKLAGEMYCKAFHQVYGLSYVCLRYFNVYGPRQDPNSEYSAVVPKFISRILDNESPIIYGDGLQSRDFTFVSDVIKANILSACSTAVGVFNVATGSRITINDLAAEIAMVLESKNCVVYEDARAGDILHSLADISKAAQAFHYKPSYDIKKGLQETIEWFKQKQSIQKTIL
jgi:UDP-glucose 4-epimerase